MTVRVSPLILPFDDQVAVLKVPVDGERAVGPLVLPYTRPDSDATINLTGAGTAGQGGNVVVSLPIAGDFVQLGPMILPGLIRDLTAKVGNMTVSLVGAGAQAQGEELEGADVTMRIDGREVVAGAGDVTVSEGAAGGEPAFHNYLDMQVKDIAMAVVTKDNAITMASKSIEFVVATKRIDITLQEQLTFIEQEPSGGAPIT